MGLQSGPWQLNSMSRNVHMCHVQGLTLTSSYLLLNSSRRVFTLLVGCAMSSAIFAWGTFAPSKAFGGDVLAYQNAIKGMTDGQLDALNSAAANGGAPAGLAAINKSWNAMTQATKSHPWPSTTIRPAEVTNMAMQTNAMLLENAKVVFKG